MSVLDIWTGLCFMVFKTNSFHALEPGGVDLSFSLVSIQDTDKESNQQWNNELIDCRKTDLEIKFCSQFWPNTKPEMSRHAHIVSRSKMAIF